MKKLLAYIEQKTCFFAANPLFTYLADTDISAQEKLQLAPCMAHFVFTFMDINRFVLPQPENGCKHQRLINIHAQEDACHWPWYLHDMQLLGFNATLPLSQTLGFLWGDVTQASRLLSYECIRLLAIASPVQKLALVETIEMTGKVFLGHTARICNSWQHSPGELLYFGQNHADCETGHHMGTDDAVGYLESIQVSDEDYVATTGMLDTLFHHYSCFADSMLGFAQRLNSNQPVSSDMIYLAGVLRPDR